ncbi:UBA/THIF-type NAD/FAD binding protein [Desulfovibrio sp. X2]|uniref:HesA/MoeB/ThiF family protein n=1 Tax=Desulfovibrio sp. X2 TaxID=941449 RepID=UPI0003588336|nr:ThiF family adenylyltransferase [Desulfovibrio sp. X2]EPR43585.1 UBA/THIF-type NAD/FAD binding protein [Desulfovibrio sp. X2]
MPLPPPPSSGSSGPGTCGPAALPLADLLRAAARAEKQPDNSEALVIAGADLLTASRRAQTQPWEAAETALSLGIVPARYQRNLGAFGCEGQLRLHRSSAAMVGLGGLGGLALESLARLGVGNIRGADGDFFEESNLNRQLLCEADSLFGPKSDAAARRVRRINPLLRFFAVRAFLEAGDMAEFLSGADVALDCLGGLAHRPALEKAAGEAGIPLVTAAVAGWSGYVAVVMPGATGPAALMGASEGGAEDTLGTQPPAIYTASAIMAGEAARLLAFGKSALAGRMLLFDLERQTYDTVSI